jgi:peptidyl-prolyl cis-trans isomerase D
MAVLEQIRTRAGILIAVIIGVALFAFIINDALSSGRLGRKKNLDNIGIIKGKEIKYSTFQNRYDFLENLQLARLKSQGITSLPAEQQFSLKNMVWSEFIQEKVYMSEAYKTGMDVHSSELMHAINGPNPDPEIRRIFTDENGVFNREMLNMTINQIRTLDKNDPQYQEWYELNERIYRNRLMQKYVALLQNGCYVTDLEAKRNYINTVESADIEYIVKRYTSISDSSVNIKESELKEYYKKHKNEYKQEESVDLSYASFEIFPSEEDYKYAEDWIKEQINDFRDKKFIYKKSVGEIYEPGELSPKLDSFMFNSKIKSVYGPYLEDGSYKIAVLDSVVYLPDSVRVSHLLIPYPQTEQQQASFYVLIDSLYKLAEDGYNFNQLVLDNSADGMTRENGGNLGWINNSVYGRMFDDSVYFANVGDIKRVQSQQGIHIIKITAQSPKIKKVIVRTLDKQVRPSDETDKIYYDKASKFAYECNTIEKFNKAVSDGGIVANTKYNLSPNEFSIDDIENSRKLIRWAFQAKEGELSKVERYGDKYIVAIVEKSRKKGIVPFEDIKSEITIDVKKEEKGKMLSKEMKKAEEQNNNLEGIASKMNATVENADNVTFMSASSVSSSGTPVSLGDIAGASIAMKKDVVSPPIIGENGVYVLKVIDKTEPDLNNINYSVQKNILLRNQQNLILSHLFETLEEKADIKDFRVNFY